MAGGAAIVLLALMWGVVLVGPAHAQGHDDLAGLLSEFRQLHDQSRYTEATPIAQRAVALAHRRYGDGHTEFASAVGWLAKVYHGQGSYAEAEYLYQRSLAIFEKALGPDDLSVGIALNNLALLYHAQDRHAEAQPLLAQLAQNRGPVLGKSRP